MSKTVVYFDPSINGLGDCIIGCVSAFVLSQVLEAEFRILNGSIKFFNFFNIPDMHRAETFPNDTTKIEYWADKNGQTSFWTKENVDQLKGRSICIRSCQNFGKFLFRDSRYSHLLRVPETEIINHLFSKILIPHDRVQEKFAQLYSELKMSEAICVHIRCDDVWGDSNSGECRFKVNETIDRFIECIRQIGNNRIILVTDNLERVDAIFKARGVAGFAISGKASHSSKSSEVDYDKTILDLLTIGACKEAVISYWSNFSRIGVLRTLLRPWIVQVLKTNNLVNFDFNIQLDNPFRKAELAELLSKEK